jgi:hypothetical protein
MEGCKMTHFVGIVRADTEEEMERMLAPYDEQLPSVPYFEYMNEGKDWNEYEEMCRHYKTADLEELVDHMQDWNGCQGEIRNGRLGSYHTYNNNSKWDWYVVGGRWEDAVPGNQCLAEEVTKYFTEYTPSVVVDRKGWHTSKDFGWFGYSTPVEGNDDVVQQKLKEHKGKNVFIVDFHI